MDQKIAVMINCPFGVFSYKIIELDGEAEATVTFVLPEEAPDNAEFYKISDDEWHKINFERENNASEITVTLTDGDPNTDEDGS